MDFSMQLWLFPLFVVPGLWLAVRLYLRGPLGRSETRRLVPAILYSLGWLGIGLLALSPLWRWPSETWHPPLVALVVDESESYAALGARDSARRVVRAARAHYEALGFKVVETGFDPAMRKGPAAVADFSNLQAVLMWTDGRFDPGETPWPAPVFPVRVHLASGEIQGERVEVHLAARGADGTQPAPWLMVEARMAGSGAPGPASTQAEIVIQDGEKLLWKTNWNLAEGGSDRSAASRTLASGERVSARFTLPRELAQGDPSRWTVRVRPARAAANLRAENDTVPVTVRGNNRPMRLVLRPLVSLEERGLLDALRNNGENEKVEVGDDAESNAARAVDASELRDMELSPRMVVWVRADARVLTEVAQTTAKATKQARATLVVYERTRSGETFGPDARLGWRAGGGAHLPAGALRLADIGVSDAASAMPLRAPDASIEALAWAEENGRRGVLFWRNRRDGRFGFALPPLWRATFTAGASSLEATRATADVSAQWTRGASEWARALGSVADSARDARSNKGVATKVSTNEISTKTQAPELSRLGSDVEALAQLAISGNGNTINSYSNDIDNKLWPVLAGGQTRAASTRIVAFAPPFFTALLVAALFSIVWWMRKRLRLD
jgi:hypothetical protein